MTSIASGKPSVVLIGSFGKHMPQIVEAAQTFRRFGYEVLSPPGIASGIAQVKPSSSDDFLVLEADDPVDPKTLQDRVLAKMQRASFVYWVNPDGYIGKSTAWEFGNAHAMRRQDGSAVPIYAWCKPNNATFTLYLGGMIYDPESLCRRLSDLTDDRSVTGGINLFFDVDDTLLATQAVFQRFENAVEKLMPGFRWDLTRAEQLNIPSEGYGYGYGKASYVASFVEAFYSTPWWLRLGKRRNFQAFKKIVAQLIKALSDAPPALPHVRETLQTLQGRNYALHVLTRGIRQEQVDKLVANNLHTPFSTINVVPRKDPLALTELAERLCLGGSQCYMIGNSPRWDVWPALQAGWNAIHVRSDEQWVLEEADVEFFPNYRQHYHAMLEHLYDVHGVGYEGYSPNPFVFGSYAAEHARKTVIDELMAHPRVTRCNSFDKLLDIFPGSDGRN